MSQVHGTIDPRFARVRDAFASCFSDGLEQGGAVAAIVDGRVVADLWGGSADAAGTRPWQEDTLVNVWSVTKGVMAAAIAMLVERGTLAYDRPIAGWWPEFAAGGKGDITLDVVMSHRAGLNGLSTPLDEAGLLAWSPYVDALAAMTPLYEPGTVCAYHALTYGHLTGEPMRRVTGMSPGQWVVREIAGRLGVPFYIGLPEREDHRVAELIEGPKASNWVADVAASLHPEASRNPVPRALSPNERSWRAAEVPGGNGHGTARSLARIYGALVGGPDRLVTDAGLAEAIRLRFAGQDLSFNLPTAYGAGFRMLDNDFGPRASKRTFGHSGWGGAIAFADPDARLGFAFVTNRMLGFDDGDPRRRRLIDAVYEGFAG